MILLVLIIGIFWLTITHKTTFRFVLVKGIDLVSFGYHRHDISLHFHESASKSVETIALTSILRGIFDILV